MRKIYNKKIHSESFARLIAFFFLKKPMSLIRFVPVVLVVVELTSLVVTELFDPVGVAQRVERVLDIAVTRRDHGDHADTRVLANERVAQHFGERGAAKRHVRVTSTERANALLESQQRLVDLGAFHPRDSVGRGRVLAAFAARQVDQRDLAVLFARLVAQNDLKDCVRTRRVLIGRGRARRAYVHAVLDALEHVLDRVERLFAQVDHLHLVLVVFEDAQFLLVVEQVEHFAAVDLKERAVDVQAALELGSVHLLKHVSSFFFYENTIRRKSF